MKSHPLADFIGNTPLVELRRLPGIGSNRLLAKLARGEETLRAVTLVEGWTFRQFRAALQKEDGLKGDTITVAYAWESDSQDGQKIFASVEAHNQRGEMVGTARHIVWIL